MLCSSLVGPLALALLAGGGARAHGSVVASQEAPATAEKKLATLVERFQKQQSDVYEAYAKADKESEGKGVSEAQATQILAGLPGKEYIPEFEAIAAEARGTDTGARAYLWVLQLVEDERSEWQRIVDILLEEHMQSAALADLAGRLGSAVRILGEGPAVEALRAIVAESPHEKVRAGALFSLGKVLLDSRSPESKAEGRDCLEAVIAEYGELSNGWKTFGKAAEGELYERDHLQVGMVAPDFESVDENGVTWKLSDYRGKVVVVDFWGFW